MYRLTTVFNQIPYFFGIGKWFFYWPVLLFLVYSAFRSFHWVRTLRIQSVPCCLLIILFFHPTEGFISLALGQNVLYQLMNSRSFFRLSKNISYVLSLHAYGWKTTLVYTPPLARIAFTRIGYRNVKSAAIQTFVKAEHIRSLIKTKSFCLLATSLSHLTGIGRFTPLKSYQKLIFQALVSKPESVLVCNAACYSRLMYWRLLKTLIILF